MSPTVVHKVETAPADPSGGPQLAELSRRLVRLMRRDAGRGPTVVRCHWAGPDVLLAIFGDGFLLSEKTLLSHGLEGVAMAYRGAIQQTLRNAMRDEVERATGRRVIAAMGCAHHDPDLMAELFVFEPPTDQLEDERFAKAGSGAQPEPAGAASADGAPA